MNVRLKLRQLGNKSVPILSPVHSRTSLIIGLSATASGLGELILVLRVDPWRALKALHDPLLPQGCPATAIANTIFYVKLWLTTAITISACCGAVSAWSTLLILRIWTSGDAADRAKRVKNILLRIAIYGSLLFLISPKPIESDIGCFRKQLWLYGSAGLSYIAIAAVMIAVWAVQLRIDKLAGYGRSIVHLQHYLTLRRTMQLLFTLASLVLVAAVIQVAIRQRLVMSITAEMPSTHADVLLEGLRYTLLLATAYIPVHMRFNSAGQSLLDFIIARPTALKGEQVKKWVEEKKAAEDILSLSLYDWKAFGPGIAVIAPTVAGVVTKIVTGFMAH